MKFILFPVIWIICAFIVTIDSSHKRGEYLGTLWGLVTLILGPIAFIAYFAVRNSD